MQHKAEDDQINLRGLESICDHDGLEKSMMLAVDHTSHDEAN